MAITSASATFCRLGPAISSSVGHIDSSLRLASSSRNGDGPCSLPLSAFARPKTPFSASNVIATCAIPDRTEGSKRSICGESANARNIRKRISLCLFRTSCRDNCQNNCVSRVAIARPSVEPAILIRREAANGYSSAMTAKTNAFSSGCATPEICSSCRERANASLYRASLIAH